MLPPGEMRVRLAPDVRLRDGGGTILGGAPRRLLRCAPAGAALILKWRSGGSIGAATSHRQLARRLLSNGILLRDPLPCSAFDDVQIVVPAHGREEALRRCLAALHGSAEIIVVDDGTPHALDAPDARFVRRERPGGPAAARNCGLRMTQAPYIAFVDSDVIVPPGWLHRLLAHFDDPAVGAVAPRITAASPDGSFLSRYEARHSSLDMGAAPARVHVGGPVPYVPATAIVVRRAAIPHGGFDESLQIGEDVDFVWRMIAAGWDVGYDPAVTVRHEHRVTLGAFAVRRWQYACSIGPLARRHGDALAPLAIAPSAALAALALLRGRIAITAVVIIVRAIRTGRTLPGPLTAELTVDGYRALLQALARAVLRTWSPIMVLMAPFSVTARRAIGAAILIRASNAGAMRYLPARLADDLLAGTGTWAGSWHARTWRPLVPRRIRRSGRITPQ